MLHVNMIRMKLHLAARLSRVDKYSNQTGIETQDQRSREWAEREGHQVVSVSADRKSGTVAPWDRPDLRPWVTRPELMARYDGIVAYKNDRLSRGAWQDEVRIRLWAEENGKVLLIADGPQWPPRHAGDKWAWEAMADQARREWESIQERNVRFQKQLRDGGYLVGSPSPGYRIVRLDDHKTLEPDPAMFRQGVHVLKTVTMRYLEGDTLSGLCGWLDAEGVKTVRGGPWSPTSLRNALENPALKGRRKNADGQTVLRFPGILDDSTWAKLQDRLREAKQNPQRGAMSADPALLSRIIYCDKCGQSLRFHGGYNMRKDGTKTYKYYYRCSGSSRNLSRCKNMIPVPDADEWVSSWVTDVIGGQELIARVVVPGHGYGEEIREINREIQAVDPDDPLWLDKTTALRAEKERLRTLPETDPEILERPTGVKVRDHWDGLATTAARRSFLLAGKVKVLASREPFRFSVEAYMGEWTV